MVSTMSESELLGVVMNHMRHGIVVYDDAERILANNRHVSSIFGFAESAITIGATLSEYLARIGDAVGWSPERIAGVIDNHRMWARAGEPRQLDHHFDSGRIFEISFIPLDQGGAVLTFADVSHERRLHSVGERRETLTREAGTMLRRVAEIAAQNRVVAFNASIEAARIGERGQAFAVVADEVRHLSRETSDVLHDINRVIEESLRLI